MNAYLLVLEGQGDQYGAVVDEETWAWINSAVPDFARGQTSWSERDIMPASVRAAIDKNAEEHPGDADDQLITIGSFENDRAMHVCSYGASLFCEMADIGEAKRDAKRWAKEKGYKIVGTFDGCIY